MAFTILIDQFEGPLDLMLHLIKDHKLDLFELDMDTLTKQYLQYIHAMEIMHLEVASEFLSELAGLLEYKSKKLLPREKVEIAEEYEEDQRDRLMKRLCEYQRFKDIREQFEKKYEERQLLMSKPISEETQKWLHPAMEGAFVATPYDLIKAMQKVLHRAALQQPQETKMTIQELSLDERVLQIRKRLAGWIGKMRFDELCNDCVTIHMRIVTFLSILDLIKHREIMFHIDEDEHIWILRGDEAYG